MLWKREAHRISPYSNYILYYFSSYTSRFPRGHLVILHEIDAVLTVAVAVGLGQTAVQDDPPAYAAVEHVAGSEEEAAQRLVLDHLLWRTCFRDVYLLCCGFH